MRCSCPSRACRLLCTALLLVGHSLCLGCAVATLPLRLRCGGMRRPRQCQPGRQAGAAAQLALRTVDAHLSPGPRRRRLHTMPRHASLSVACGGCRARGQHGEGCARWAADTAQADVGNRPAGAKPGRPCPDPRMLSQESGRALALDMERQHAESSIVSAQVDESY